MKTIFKRVKKTFKNDETKAFESVCKKSELKPEQLKPNHSEKEFIWELIVETEKSKNFQILKTDVVDENEAIVCAMELLDTFEGNLKADHTDTHFVFSKVR